MNKLRICVYAICKNEEQFAQRWMNSMKEADMVVVTDTGSTDGTVDMLRSAGAIVHEEKIHPWRFDTARNIAMDHVPEDVDICVSSDLDEVFVPGWRQMLEEAWDPSYTRVSYLFTWSYHADGTPNKQFSMEKIHRRAGFRWVHPVHEVLKYSGPGDEKKAWVPGLILYHHPDLTKPRSQYLPLLELSAQENPEDDRVAFWLGREYFYYRKNDMCIKALLRYLSLPMAKWDEERSAAMRFIGSAYEAKGDNAEAKAWYFKAIAECPYVREPYVAMAKLSYGESNWLLTYAMVIKGLGETRHTGSYLTEPQSWGHALFDYGAISAYHLGLFKKSREYARKALEFQDDDPRLLDNLHRIESAMEYLTDEEVEQ